MNLTSKPKRAAVKWIAALAVVAGISSWYFSIGSNSDGRNLTQVEKPPAEKANTAPLTEADRAVLAEDAGSGDSFADQLAKEGWKETQTPEPEHSLIALDPSLIPSREDEIQRQLQSNSFAGDALNAVAEIARKTDNRKTRLLALEALADSDDTNAQKIMTELYRDPKFDGEAREQILGSLRPTSPKDEVAGFLLEEIRNGENSEGTKLQALAPLVVMNLMNEHSRPDPDIVARLPLDSRRKYLEMYRVMLSGEDPDIPDSWSGEEE